MFASGLRGTLPLLQPPSSNTSTYKAKKPNSTVSINICWSISQMRTILSLQAFSLFFLFQLFSILFAFSFTILFILFFIYLFIHVLLYFDREMVFYLISHLYYFIYFFSRYSSSLGSNLKLHLSFSLIIESLEVFL